MVALSRLSRRRLVALFLLVNLLPLASLAYLAISITTDSTSRHTRQSLTLSATVSALYVRDQLQGLAEIVDSFAHQPDLTGALGNGNPADYNLAVVGETLNHVGSIRPGIASAILLSPGGRVIDVYPFQPSVTPGADLSARDWYVGVDGSRRPYVSPVYISSASGNPQVVAIAAPVDVLGGDGTPGPLLGFLAIEYGSQSIERFTQAFAAAQDVVVRVADQRGMIVGQSQNVDVSQDQAAVRAALRGETGLTQVGSTRPVLVAYAPVPVIGWAVTAQIDIADAFAEVDRLRTTVLAIAGALALILLGGSWLLNVVLGYWQRAEAEIKRLAAIDSLTGLWNRRSWDTLVARELARATRERSPLSVAMLDMDHFKEFNDLRGHLAGDRLLTAAAEAWRGAIRATDVLARYGGEEFALALPDCSVPNAVAIVERLRAALPQGQTCSAGVAAWNGTESAAEVLARADSALYAAKRAGRDRVMTADDAPPSPSLVEAIG